MCSQLQCLSLEGRLDGWVPYQEVCSFPNIARLSKVDTCTEHACFFPSPQQTQTRSKLPRLGCSKLHSRTKSNQWLAGWSLLTWTPAQIVIFFNFASGNPSGKLPEESVSFFKLLIPWLGPLRFCSGCYNLYPGWGPIWKKKRWNLKKASGNSSGKQHLSFREPSGTAICWQVKHTWLS